MLLKATFAITILLVGACDQVRGREGNGSSRTDNAFSIDTVATYGVIDGPADRVFGFVQHAAVGADYLFVLDEALKHVRVLDHQLEHVMDFGQPGPGPLELLGPMGIATVSNDRVVVGDRGYVFKTFSVTEDTAALASSFTFHVKADDFCAMRDELFIRAWDGTSLIHRVSLDGRILDGFGEGWESESELARQERSEGIIGCHAQAGVIAAMFDFDPTIFGYSPEGELRWQTSISDYHQARIEEGTNAAGKPMVMFYDNPPHDMAAKIVPFGPHHFLVQLGLITTEGGDRSAVFRLYAIDARDGTVQPWAERIPLLIAADSPRVITADIEPFPRVIVLEQRQAENP